jgi:Type II secretory pathway, component PulF
MNLKNSKINKKNLSVLCRQISFMLDAGISISKVIEILSMQQENKSMQLILKDVHKNILKGNSFSDCLLKYDNYFPSLMINMIKAGENSGTLNEIMQKIADYYETQYKFISDLKRAMTYPLIVCIMMLIVLIMAITLVIPSYAQMFLESGAQLPMITKIVIGISNFVSNYFLYLILLFIIIFLIGKKFLNTNKGKIFYGRLLLLAPIKKIYFPWINLVFAQVMGMLLESGVSVIFAIENVKWVIANKFLDREFDEIINEIRSGVSISKSVGNSKRFSQVLIAMINVGESSGNLTNVFAHCQRYFENEFNNNLNDVQKLIEPALTIFIGIVLGIIMIAIMEPTFTMSNIL